MLRVWLALVAIAVCAVAGAIGTGCKDDGKSAESSGPARSFRMGFSALPRTLDSDAYSDAIDVAGDNGDIILIQRTPPWSEFAPDGAVSNETAKSTAAERDAIKEKHLKLFFAIDPTDGASGRDRLASLPSSLAGKRFDDPDVRSAFASYAEYIALNYKPAYMALGVEMNLYYEKNKADFANFRSLYEETYARVKKQSPSTQVSLTFQYEDLLGLLPREDQHFADWQLLKQFDAVSDFVAINSYPGFAFASPDKIPRSYYSQLTAFTDKPIAFAEMGYSSGAGQQGVNSGSEDAQSAFLARALTEASALRMPFVVWFSIWDPTFARDTAYAAYQSIGLRRDDDSAKPAWDDWTEAARRPYQPQ